MPETKSSSEGDLSTFQACTLFEIWFTATFYKLVTIRFYSTTTTTLGLLPTKKSLVFWQKISDPAHIVSYLCLWYKPCVWAFSILFLAEILHKKRSNTVRQHTTEYTCLPCHGHKALAVAPCLCPGKSLLQEDAQSLAQSICRRSCLHSGQPCVHRIQRCLNEQSGISTNRSESNVYGCPVNRLHLVLKPWALHLKMWSNMHFETQHVCVLSALLRANQQAHEWPRIRSYDITVGSQGVT